MTSPLPFGLPRRGLRLFRRPTDAILPSSPRPQRRDCQGRLIAALLAIGGESCTLADAMSRPWCSATFIGAQHRIILCLSGEGADACAQALAARLPEADLPLPGHIVADLAIDGIRQGEDGAILLDLAILTIEDW